MKKKNILWIVIGSITLSFLSACNNDDKTIIEDGKVNVNKTIDFSLNFGDYNNEQKVEGTRSIQQEQSAKSQTLNIGNGIIAVVTLQKDTAKTRKPEIQTRALPNDTYTMLAYDAGGILKGEVTGTVTGGTFTPTSANQDIILEPGTYTFICFNSKVSRNGNTLIVTRVNAGEALIGRTENVNITATPRKQKVNFNMQHTAARIRIQLTGYMNFAAAPKATLSSVNATDIPGTETYDITTGTWTIGNGEAMNSNLTFPASGIAISNEYAYFMPTTDGSKLKLTFTAGNIYTKDMTGYSITLNPNPVLTMERNHSYLINIKLMNNFRYLFTDGSVGGIAQTTFAGGPSTPIGVVISQGYRIAVALKDIGYHSWCNKYEWGKYEHNTTASPTFSDHIDDMKGYEYTWTKYYNNINVIRGYSTDYPAFYAAGHYIPTLPAGVQLTGGMVGKQWHLPAMGEWVQVLKILGLGNIYESNPLGGYKQWGAGFTINSGMMNAAFAQVGGTGIYAVHWTSSEYGAQGHPGGLSDLAVATHSVSSFYYPTIGDANIVRPFIRY
jgi:hypothetical protein